MVIVGYFSFCNHWIMGGGRIIRFVVIDLKTKNIQILKIWHRMKKWVKNLIPCDTEAFHIGESGALCLADECGNYSYFPHDRFKVVVEIQDIKMDYLLTLGLSPNGKTQHFDCCISGFDSR